jgi:GTPase SAR1 family protein
MEKPTVLRKTHYIIVVEGSSAVGKSAFIRRLSHGDFSEDYTPTVGMRTTILKFNTSAGEIMFEIRDLPSRLENPEMYYKDADCLLAFYSVHITHSRENAILLAKQRKAISPSSMYVILCGNKADDATIRYMDVGVYPALPFGYSLCRLSAKSAYGIERPFLLFLNIAARKASCPGGNITFVDYPSASTEKALYEVPFSDKMLQHCLALMTALPRQIDVEKTGPNMVSMTGKGSDTTIPELFQVIQEQDGTYSYQHLECGTSKVIGHLINVDPSHFVFPHKLRATSIEVREGVDTINLYPSLMRNKVISNTQKRVYLFDAENGYDGFGEPLRDDLEDTLCEMGEKGYSAIIEVTISYYKEGA